MRRMAILMAGLSVLLLGVLLGSCANLTLAGNEAVTFALVIDDASLLGDVVIADIRDGGVDGARLDTVSAEFAMVPGSSTTVTAHLTTTERLQTGQRYLLDFYIDMDSSGNLSPGDRSGVQTFDVMPNSDYVEANFFAVNLFTET